MGTGSVVVECQDIDLNHNSLVLLHRIIFISENSKHMTSRFSLRLELQFTSSSSPLSPQIVWHIYQSQSIGRSQDARAVSQVEILAVFAFQLIMRKPRIEELVISRLFPQKKDIDPSDWQNYIRRSLVQEVRQENVCFYGTTSCLESRYPGLDYADPAHRLRLNRFPCHRKLFRVFDELRLTDYEIQRLCKWEGTRSARETYEVNKRVKIKDTTWNGIHDFRGRTATITVASTCTGGAMETETGDISDNDVEPEDGNEEMRDYGESEEPPEEESEDELQRSVGADLNQRLLAATEARARGEEATIDADWEQWLREAAERSNLPNINRSSNALLTLATPSQTPRMYWGREIPEFLIEDFATLQARLPPPLLYFTPAEASSAIATALTVPPPANPAGIAM